MRILPITNYSQNLIKTKTNNKSNAIQNNKDIKTTNSTPSFKGAVLELIVLSSILVPMSFAIISLYEELRKDDYNTETTEDDDLEDDEEDW